MTNVDNEQGIFEQVLHGDLDFETDPWLQISEGEKGLVGIFRPVVSCPKIVAFCCISITIHQQSAIACITQHIFVNPSITAVGLHPYFQSVLPVAMERAVNELVPGIMQHSVSIAIQTTKEILIKEPLRALLTVQLRNVLQSLNIANELIQFRAMNKLEKMALRVIADALSNREIAGLTEMVKMIDTDNNGQITYEDLKVEMQKVGAYLKESEIYDMMQAVRFKSWFSMLK